MTLHVAPSGKGSPSRKRDRRIGLQCGRVVWRFTEISSEMSEVAETEREAGLWHSLLQRSLKLFEELE